MREGLVWQGIHVDSVGMTFASDTVEKMGRRRGVEKLEKNGKNWGRTGGDFPTAMSAKKSGPGPLLGPSLSSKQR
jgi:hypothetical protein